MTWYAQKNTIAFPIMFNSIKHPMNGNWTLDFEYDNELLDFPISEGDALLICNNEIIDDVGRILVYAGIIRQMKQSPFTTYVKMTGRTIIPTPLRPFQIIKIQQDKAITMLTSQSTDYTSELIKVQTELVTVGRDLSVTLYEESALTLSNGLYILGGSKKYQTIDLYFTSNDIINKTIVRKLIKNNQIMLRPEGSIVMGEAVNEFDINSYLKNNYEITHEYIIIDHEYFKYYSNISAIEYRESDMIIRFL